MVMEDGISDRLSSVTNAARILKSFSSTRPVIRVSDIAEELGVSKSTISRLIKTLVAEGFLEKDNNSGGYRLGSEILSLAGMFVNAKEIYREVAPVLNEIVLQTGESAHIAVLEGTDVLYIDKIESPLYASIRTQLGLHNPAHATSSGKVLLGFGPEEVVDQLFHGGVEAFTEKTIVNPIQFKQELEKVREQGYALSVEEITKNNYSLAVPVRDNRGKVVCALSIVGPLARINKGKLKSFIQVLIDAADEASERLGYGID